MEEEDGLTPASPPRLEMLSAEASILGRLLTDAFVVLSSSEEEASGRPNKADMGLSLLLALSSAEGVCAAAGFVATPPPLMPPSADDEESEP